MSLPRPLLFALLGAVLVGAAFFATRAGSGADPEPASSPVAQKPEAPAPKLDKGKGAAQAKPATTDAREALRGAGSLRSGTFALSISAPGTQLDADGRFQSKGLGKAPQFDVGLQAKAGGRAYDLRAISDGERGYLVRGDQAIVLQPEGWRALRRARAELASGGPSKESFNGYSKRELDSLKLVGQSELKGAPVLHFRGAVEAAAARKDFDATADVFESTVLPSKLPAQLARSISGGTIDVWVGRDDHIAHRETLRFRYGGGTMVMDVRRGELNEPQKIAAPAGAKPKQPAAAGFDRDAFGLGLSALTVGMLGVEPGEAASKPARLRLGNRDSRPASPAQIKRAVANRRVVILFFRQRGADDDAVAGSVDSVRGRKGVSVFTLPVGRAPKYADVGGANVVRAPTLVLLVKGRDPRMFEGFIDPATLSQAVADAR